MPSRADVARAASKRRRLGRVHAGRGLVEREQLRLGGQRARDLEPALVAVRQVLREVVGAPRDADVVEQLVRALLDRASPRRACGASRRIAPNTPACVRTWRPIITFSSAERLANRRMFWNVRAMPRAATSFGLSPSSGRPSNMNVAAVGVVDAGQHVEEAGLAGAVRADEAVDLARGGSRSSRRRAPARRRSAC